MPPKKGGKKGKKQADDNLWEDKEVTIPGLDALNDDDYIPSEAKPAPFSTFSALDEESGKYFEGEDMGSGLMGAIQANINKKTVNKVVPLADDIDEDEDSPTVKILTKKEKEKLKKEREKAKKKAQAQTKKAELTSIEPVTSPSPSQASQLPPDPTIPSSEPPNADAEDEDENAEGDGNAKSDKKKKKKKKPAGKETPKEPTKKKPSAGLAALIALREQQKAAEEEARRREEEERLRIEEEERRLEEEARLKEEAKQKRKEKEKAKRELAKKEGRLLTDKQKKEKAQAEIARKALLASGVRIEGLERAQSSNTPKKVVYGSKKKKPVQRQDQSPAPSIPRSLSPENVEKSAISSPATNDSPLPSEEQNAIVDRAVKDEWDVSTDDDEPEPSTASKEVGGNGISEPKKVPSQRQDFIAVEHSSNVESESELSASSSASSDSDSDVDSSSEESSDEEMTIAQKQAAQRKAEAAERRVKRHEDALAARTKDDLRSPICCILGHVDTGKTKLLDKIRQTNVQEGEAGGITQQIGATYFPVEAIREKTAVLNTDGLQEYKIPGLLVIDTPGHESFTNLRSRGSSLCNIAVLVVDIMHGLEPQTIESLRLLRERKTPFVVALNKIDRLYGWVPIPNGGFRESLAKQSPSVQREFANRCEETVVAFAEQGLNAVLYYDNKNMSKNVSLIPTSAVTGEGVPDMIMLLVNLTQQRMSDRLMYLSEVECTVLEVKIIEGLGTTIDVVLSNGILREGDKIVLCGLNGPIVTQVRALLTPQPMRELRIKSAYVHHKEVKAALGVKITAPDLEKAIAGSRLLVLGPDDDEDDLRDEVMSDLTGLLNSVDRSGRGVTVQASTLGSLEALLDFLKVSKIPVAGIGLGPVHKRDIMQAATMLERAKELACILCFDVPVDKDAERIAEELGIKIFKADIIYHLFDAFTAYNAEIMEAKRRDAAPQAVWPCRLKTIAAFAKRDPIILGVDILDGTLRVGTPICVVKTDVATGKKEVISLGKITSLEINHKSMDIVKKSQAGGGVAVKIEHAVYQSAKMFGRHFDEKDELYSQITRQSIDVLKESFRKDVSPEEWQLIKALKQRLDIP